MNDSNCFVSGDELYLNAQNRVSIPAGTIIIEETKAPNGYLLNEDKLVMTIDISGDKSTRRLYDANGKLIEEQPVTINEDQPADANTRVGDPPITFDLDITKEDKQITAAQGDAELSGIKYAVVNNTVIDGTDTVVSYDGTDYPRGQVVTIMTTDANGKVSTTGGAFMYGTYDVYELRADANIKAGDVYASANKGTSKYANNKGYLFAEQKQTVNGMITKEEDGKVFELTFKDDIARGDVSFIKIDNELDDTYAQGDATLSGAVIEIFNDSEKDVVVGGKTYKKGEAVLTVTTDANGRATTSNKALPYGTYHAVEKTPSKGYHNNDAWRVDFQIREDGVNVDTTKDEMKVTASKAADAKSGWFKKTGNKLANGSSCEELPEQVIRGGVSFLKVSRETLKAFPQGGATLEGAEITIYNNSHETILVKDNGEERWIAPGEAVMTLTTDADGKCSTSKDALPYGTYYAIETKKSEGYLLNDEWRVDFVIREEGVIVDTASDEFKLTDYTEASIETHKFCGTCDMDFTAAGMDSSAMRNHQLDHLIAGEGSSNAYERSVYNNNFKHDTSSSVKSGWFAVAGNTNQDDESVAATLTEQVGRRAFEFEKTLEGVERVGNCLFEVTLVETGEVHYIMTDNNGSYNSRRFDNNNGNDEAVTKNEDGSYTVDESKLSYKNNVWFSMDTEGNVVEPIEGYDAYPYGTYLFKEIRTSVNEGFTLITFTANVEDDNYYLAKDGDVYNLGTKDDTIPTIHTTAYNDDDRFGKLDSSAETVTIVDKIEYDNLIIGNKYKFQGKLWDKTNNQYVADEEGNPVTAWSDVITAKAKSGYLYMTFEIPGSYINDTEKVVVFESLFEIEADKEDVTDKDTPITEHIDPNDIEQTVPVEPNPEIGTTLTDENGSHIISSDGKGEIVVTDTVAYSGLEKGKEYVVTGKLHSKEDNSIIAESEPVAFKPERSSGTIEVEFTIKASDAVEKHLVAFEYLTLKGQIVATHEDPEDPDQTVTVLPEPEKKYSDDILQQKDPVLSETKVVYETKQIGYDLTWVNDTENKATVELKDTLSAGITYDEGSAIDEKGEKLAPTKVTVNEDGTTVLYWNLGEKEAATFGHVQYTVTVNSKAATTEERHQVNNDYDLKVTKEGEDPERTPWRKINDLHNPVPEIGTVLKDAKTKDHIANADKTVELKDTVNYKGLQPETQYKVTGQLFNKTTGKLTNIKAEATFTSSATGEGSTEVTFKFDGTKLAGNSLVAFEYMYDVKTGDLVGKHENPDDPEQTVHIPEIKTSLASDKGAKDVTASKTTVLIDKVSYKNLIPGKEYVMEATLMDKATKKSTGITATQKFKASETGNGTVDVKFTLDSTKYAGKELVAFEKAYIVNGNAKTLVGKHEDFNDKAQTVKITNPKQPATPTTKITKTPSSPKTGDTTNVLLWVVLSILAAGMAGTLIIVSQKNRNE